MKQLIYRLIYSGFINSILRNILKSMGTAVPASFRLPVSGKINIHTQSGSFMMHTNQTNYLTRCVFWDGYKNFEYSEIFERLSKKVRTFYDVGANIGFYSLFAATSNPGIKITAFEPAIGPLYYLRKNVAANKMANIQIESIALSDKNGVIDFYEVKSTKYSYLKYNLAGEGNAGSKTSPEMFIKNKVQSVTFDDYLLQHPNEKVELMKMDTEGTEHFILAAANILLSSHQPIIICETLFHANEKELEAVLQAYGYEFYNHTSKGLQKTTSIIRETDNGVRNCFFIHPTKKHLIEEFIAV